MVNRIATFSSTERLISDNMRLQSALNDTQVQLSTGLKSTNYKGIANVTQQLLNIERNQTSLENYNVNAKTVSNNIDIAYNAVGSMLELANNFMTTLTAAQGGNTLDPLVTKNQADILTQEMVGLLNTQSAGRYLFAGSMYDVKPVDLTDPAYIAQTSPSVADTNYYQGDNAVSTAQLSETLTINYGVTANNPAFEKMMRGLNLAYNNSGNVAALAEASTLIRDGISGVANLYATMSTYAHTVENQSMRNEEDMAVMTNVISNLAHVDIAATTVRQKEYESQIQASYASSVKILNMKLTDYI